MNKLRIVQTPIRFTPAIGGVEKYVLELSSELVKQGNEVTVVCADEPTSKLKIIKGIKTIRLPYLAKIANTNITLGLFRTLMRQDFDVIHTHIPTPWSADVSALVSLIKRKPLVVTFHDDLTGIGIGRIIANLYSITFMHLVLLRASKIIITQAKYLEYSKHLKWCKKKVVVVPLGVTKPLPVKNIKRYEKQLFFMSVLDKHHEYKGLNVLLEAIAKIKDKEPSLRLLVGGKGELISKYKQMSESLGISNMVDFLGYVTDEKQAKCYASSAVFVLPSVTHMEGYGIVALEALSYGTPVITTELAGSSDFINTHKLGLVIKPGNVQELSDALLELLNNPEKSLQMGKRGAGAVSKKYNWAHVSSRLLDIYTCEDREAITS